MSKNMTFWPLGMAQNFFWPTMRCELWTPVIESFKHFTCFVGPVLPT